MIERSEKKTEKVFFSDIIILNILVTSKILTFYVFFRDQYSLDDIVQHNCEESSIDG